MMYASIDVGTNSIKGSLFNSRLQLLEREVHYIRLGKDIKNRRLSSEKIRRATRILARLVRRARERGSQKIILVGTSALRSCMNSGDMVRKIRKDLNVRFHILSGKKEAYLSYLGASYANKKRLSGKRSVFMDIGAGSTELAFCRGASMTRTYSLEIGALRVKALSAQRPIFESICPLAEKQIPPDIKKHLKTVRFIVGVGGSFTTAARILLGLKTFSVKKIQRASFTRKSFMDLQNRLSRLSVKSIKASYHLHQRRADLVHAGLALINAYLHLCNPLKIFVSTEGVAKGAVIEYLIRPEKKGFVRQSNFQ